MRLVKIAALTVLVTGAALAQTQGDNTLFGLTAKWASDPALTDTIQVLTSRGLIAGVDVDGDGLLEIWSSHYDGGGGVAGFEVLNDSTMELMWIDSSGSDYSSGTRWVQVGDLDGDGANEVIYFAGRDVGDAAAGLYIMESTGNNTFDTPFFTSIAALGGVFDFNGQGDSSLTALLVENFQVIDVDGDGTEEIIFASNRGSYITDWIDTAIVGTDTTFTNFGHSEDFFGILSVTGGIGSGAEAIVSEFVTSARDIDMGAVTDPADPLFGRENKLGGGSAINVTVADTDGDGLDEIIFHAWNYFNVFVVEATGADTYSFGDTTNVRLTFPADNVALKHGSVGDLDGDGKDEVYLANFHTGAVYALVDMDGDATNLQAIEFVTINDGALYGGFGTATGDLDGDGDGDVYVATSGSNRDILDVEFNGSISGYAWNTYYWETDSLANALDVDGNGAFAISIAIADIDNDGVDEIVTSHQGIADSIATSATDSTLIKNPNYWPIRVSEWGRGTGGVLKIQEMTIITPDDYQLHAAYPNPFNPVTTIEYTLPLRKEITLTVYNLLGQEVVRLVDRQLKDAGRHAVQWNSRDAAGVQVASGTYLVVLRFGSFQKTQRITFLK